MLVFFLVQAGKGQEVEWQEVEWQEPGVRRLNGRRFMIEKKDESVVGSCSLYL